MSTWHSETETREAPIGAMGYLRAVLRGVPLAIVTFGCLALLLLVRLVERPLFGLRRPVTPYITQFVCRSAFVILRIRLDVEGRPMTQMGAAVSNHCSWLDIFTLNASKRIYFVSKAEVAAWPGIGWLARATGTVFINRKKAEAKTHKTMFEDRLRAGHRLLFFPEGTSTDGLRVLPFKSTLFAAFVTDEMRKDLWIQPVSLVYTAPKGEDPRFYGWWGDMDFAHHLVKTLAARTQGSVKIVYHPPLAMADVTDRKGLAKTLEQTVRSALPSPQDMAD